VPSGWTYERSLWKSGFFMPMAEISREMEFVSSRGDGVDVYLHVATGRTVFVGRTNTVEGRSFDAWMNEGQSRLHEANPSDAVVAFTHATRSRPNDARPWFGLGKSLRGARRACDAVPALRTAASLSPDAGEVWHELGVALVESGDADAGIDALRTAVRLSASQEVVWADLGTALWQAKHYDEAIAAMHEAFDLGASAPLTVRNYRNLCRDAHREPTAVDAFGRVRARQPSEQLQEGTSTEALPQPAERGLLDRAKRKIRAMFGARIES
jgi:Flp pilus assembly protein TadD